MAEINALIPMGAKSFDLANSLTQGVKLGNALFGGGETELDRQKQAYYEALTAKAQRPDKPDAPPEAKIGAAKEAAIAKFLRGEKLNAQEAWLVQQSGQRDPVLGGSEPLPPGSVMESPAAPAPQAAPEAAPGLPPLEMMPQGADVPVAQSMPGGPAPAAAMPPRSGGGAGMIPPGAVQMLKANPTPAMRAAFEAKYKQPADAFLR